MSENEFTDNSSKGSFFSENKLKIQKFILKGNNISKNLKLIGDLLTDICKEGKSNQGKKLILIKPFIMKKIPDINLYDYIERLAKYSKVSDEVFILVLIYIDRICGLHKINLNYFNIYKLIIASFITSIKYLDDTYYSMKFYSKLGGVTKKELINLEYEFLKLLDFKLFVGDDIYGKYKSNLNNLEDEYEDDSDK
jgi:hypothetical protein